MARLLLSKDIPEVPAPEPIRELCYDDGDLIIELTDEPQQHLLLHSSILKQVSPFFELGMKQAWDRNSTRHTHPESGEDVKVYTYKLLKQRSDRVYVLSTQTEQDHGSRYRGSCFYGPDWDASIFYQTGNAAGFDDRRESIEAHQVHKNAVAEHRAIFGLFYKADVDLLKLSYTSIANVVAYSELYDLFRFIAAPLRHHLLQRPDLWEDIRGFPLFHLGLAIKLRCKDTYLDALRHIIGSGIDLDQVQATFDLSAEHCFGFATKREKLRSATDQLTQELQALSLHTYIPHTDKEEHGRRAKTSYLSSTFEIYDVFHKCQSLAHRMFSEWLNLQLCGKGHWSHVRYENEGREGGFFQESSLCNACSIATRAAQQGKPLSLFETEAAQKFVEHLNVPKTGKPYAVEVVEECLSSLVYRMAAIAAPYIAPADFTLSMGCLSLEETELQKAQRDDPHTLRCLHGCLGRGRRGVARCRGNGRGCSDGRGGRGGRAGVSEHSARDRKRELERVAPSARNDENCHYFTCIKLDDEDVVWDESEETEEAHLIDGLEHASEDWLEALSLA